MGGGIHRNVWLRGGIGWTEKHADTRQNFLTGILGELAEIDLDIATHE